MVKARASHRCDPGSPPADGTLCVIVGGVGGLGEYVRRMNSSPAYARWFPPGSTWFPPPSSSCITPPSVPWRVINIRFILVSQST